MLIISQKDFINLNAKNLIVFLEYESVKQTSIKYNCISFNKNYSNKTDEELKKRSKNIFKFSSNSVDKFTAKKRCLSLKDMNKLEKFNETSIPEIEEFFRNLKMFDITCVDYMHTKWVYKDFEIKKCWWILWFVS